MIHSFYSLNKGSAYFEGSCSICHEELLSTEELIGHSLNGSNTQHPIHQKCAKDWAKIQIQVGKTYECPICRHQVNVNTLFSWAEKLSLSLKKVTLNALVGAMSTISVLSLPCISHQILTPFKEAFLPLFNWENIASLSLVATGALVLGNMATQEKTDQILQNGVIRTAEHVLHLAGSSEREGQIEARLQRMGDELDNLRRSSINLIDPATVSIGALIGLATTAIFSTTISTACAVSAIASGVFSTF